MRVRKPRIGISACRFPPDAARSTYRSKTLLFIEQSVAHELQRFGARAYMLPTLPATMGDAADLLADLDGLVLHGGVDVAPSSYGQEALRPEWSGDPERDAYELALIGACILQRKPLFGICRGMQLLNVFFGGTLHQDLGDESPTSTTHRNRERYDLHTHAVTVAPGSQLARMYGDAAYLQVNSLHHQGIDRLARDLCVEATSTPDGVIEAVRGVSGSSWVYGVQWHPEFHDDRLPELAPAAPLWTTFLAHAETSAF